MYRDIELRTPVWWVRSPRGTLNVMRPRALVRLALVPLLAASFVAVGAQTNGWRLIAVGDIHGAHGKLRGLLQHAGLIDSQDRWTGEQTTFVQTGDYLDRGRDVRAVMDLLMQMEKSAPAAGGRVEVLLGNHETMNLMANVRDVTPEIFATFATSDATARQEVAYDEYVAYVDARTQALGRPLPDRQTRTAWLELHPIGFVEYLEALGPDGSYGRWLRSKSVAVAIAGTVFLHGGLSRQNDAVSVEAMNDRAGDEISRFDQYRAHLISRDVILEYSTFREILAAVALELRAWTTRLFPGPPAPGSNPPTLTPEDRAHLEVLFDIQALADWSVIDQNGPLWSRDFARWSDEEGAAVVPALLERFGVGRAVVGHTVTPSRRIVPRFDDRVFLIDTGMLSETYQGRASAIELTDTSATAIYLDDRVPLTDKPP